MAVWKPASDPSQLTCQDECARLADSREVEAAARPEQKVLAQPRVSGGSGLDRPRSGRMRHDIRGFEGFAPEIELLSFLAEEASVGNAKAETDPELGAKASGLDHEREAIT